MDKLKKLLNRETVLYLIFGVATTVVNYVVFHLLYNVLWRQQNSLIANAAAFVAAVIFAFVVNKMFVFESKSWSMATLKKEVPSFLAARIGSFGIEEAGLFLAEKVLKLGGVVALTVAGVSFDWITVVKIGLAFVVVALNYVFCKLFIFKKTAPAGDEKETFFDRAPDVEVTFRFNGTRQGPVWDGYHAPHRIREDHLSSGLHRYYGVKEVAPDGTARGTITFLSPEQYPGTMWVGRSIDICEGERVVGTATVEKVLNPILNRV